MSRTLYVYFITSPYRVPATWRSIARIVLRRPVLGYRLLRHTVVLWLCGEFSHVAIGDEYVTVSPRHGCTEVWDSLDFVARHPGLAWSFDIPVQVRTELPFSVPVSGVPRLILHWLTGGAVRATHCASFPASVLDSAGITVDRRIVTPRDLFDYLREAGYEQTNLGGLPPAPARSGGEHAGNQGIIGTVKPVHALHREGAA